MSIISNFGGYRLSMNSDKPFRQSQSIQMYSGIIARIMVLFRLAFFKTFKDQKGQIRVFAINRKSLAHYVWRNNYCTERTTINYDQSMKLLYQAGHHCLKSNYSIFRSYITKTAELLESRNIEKSETCTLENFVKKIQQMAPLKGYFYKIKNENKTVGYLLGSIHIGNELMANLNPTIRKAILKSSIIAGEEDIRAMGKKKFKIKENLLDIKKRNDLFMSDVIATSKLSFDLGMEKCILKGIQERHDKKECVGLETDEEKEDSLNLGLQVSKPNLSKTKSVKQLLKNFTKVLDGDTNFLYKVYRQEQKENQLFFKNLVERNKKMTERAVPYFEKGRTLIVVGAGHLYGEEGMIHLLTTKGYKLNRK